MIIAFRSRYSLNRLYSVSSLILLSMAAGGMIWLSLSWFYGGGGEGAAEPVGEGGDEVCEQVVAGALALKQSQRSALGLAIEDRLILRGIASRPGMERAYRIGLKESEQVVRVKEKAMVSLRVGKGNQITFDEDGNVQLSLHGLDDGTVALQMDGEKIVLGRANDNEKGEEVLDLKQGKFWGQDLFYRSYGGTEFGQLGRGAKIELEHEGQSYFVYVGSGEYLTKKEGRWACVDKPENSGLLAAVKAVGSDSLDVEVWDEEGFSIAKTQWRGEKKGPVPLAADQLITGVKLRTAKQISCKIAGKRFLIKPGDWIIKMQTGWHKLVSVEEIEAYLAHRIRGDLIVFDDVDTMGRVKGHTFDSMRTQMQSFTLQAVTSKKKEKKGKGAFKK